MVSWTWQRVQYLKTFPVTRSEYNRHSRQHTWCSHMTTWTTISKTCFQHIVESLPWRTETVFVYCSYKVPHECRSCVQVRRHYLPDEQVALAQEPWTLCRLSAIKFTFSIKIESVCHLLVQWHRNHKENTLQQHNVNTNDSSLWINLTIRIRSKTEFGSWLISSWRKIQLFTE